MFALSALLCPLLLCAALGCGGKRPTAPPPPPATDGPLRCTGGGATVSIDEEAEPEVGCSAGERQLLCYGAWAAHCDADGELVSLDNCRAQGLVCAGHKCKDAASCTGCLNCVPGSVRCGEGGKRELCREDGSGYDLAETCDVAAGELCSVRSGLCENLCEAAERERSYIGCEYWAVATSNSQLLLEASAENDLCQPFPFAVVIANPQSIEVQVEIESPRADGSTAATSHRVAPGDTLAVELPCDQSVRRQLAFDLDSIDLDAGIPEFEVAAYSSRSRRAAHRITSSAPITVYQYNPLQFQAMIGGKRVPSYTNDASLLLPTHAMTGNYLALTWPTLQHELRDNDESIEPIKLAGPGFITLVGVEAQPTRVEIVSRAHTLPSEDGSLPALTPGQSLELTLERGEVVQILSATPEQCQGEASDSVYGGRRHYCQVGADHDLSGTRIRADGRVSLLAGHDCAFVPYDRWACDHLEETMFPLESWGKEVLVSQSEAVECRPRLPNVLRVLSGADDNRITFSPPIREALTLGRGEFVELEIEGDVRVTGSAAILVGQYLVGQEYFEDPSAAALQQGDPALALAIPFEQWRRDYSFLSPESFPDHFVNVIAGAGQVVLLDGHLVTGYTPIEGTQMQTARVGIEGGSHHIESAGPFGITVYGYAPYTSYMVAGGLDLNIINRPD
ncbi:MAG: IgGFc-binding protein [Myxococcales bacterium]|nr:IgGFc-binding protein [Myxococcales bacterium]